MRCFTASCRCFRRPAKGVLNATRRAAPAQSMAMGPARRRAGDYRIHRRVDTGWIRRPHAADAAASGVSSTPAPARVPVRARRDGHDTAAVIEALTAVAAATGSSRCRA